MIVNQKHIANSRFTTITQAKAAIPRELDICYVSDTRTIYQYLSSASEFFSDDKQVLTTGLGGGTRWVAISGYYEFNKLESNRTFYCNYSTGNDFNKGTSWSPWKTLDKAVAYIKRLKIIPGYTITIDISGHTSNHSSPIDIEGEIFSYVEIIGAGSSTTVLNFTGSNGLMLTSNLKKIASLKITGSSTTSYYGIGLTSCNLILGSDVKINTFSHGIYATQSSTLIAANATEILSCNYGFHIAYRSTGIINTSIGTNNNSAGIHALSSSSIYAHSCTTNNNNSYGMWARYNSFIDARSSTSTGNGVAQYSPSTQGDQDIIFGNFGSYIIK